MSDKQTLEVTVYDAVYDFAFQVIIADGQIPSADQIVSQFDQWIDRYWSAQLTEPVDDQLQVIE